MRARDRSSGFVVSTEMMLIGLILVVGLATGWAKLRDQSLAEIRDTMAAIDAYILGSGPLWQTGGTRWISTGAACTNLSLPSPCIVGPSNTGAVSEKWDNGVDPPFLAPAAVETALGSHSYKNKDGFLVYGSAPTPSTTVSGAGEAPQD